MAREGPGRHRGRIAEWSGLAAMVGLAVAVRAVLARHHGGLVAASCRWDCVWYDRIATHGYAALPQLYDAVRLGQADWAFFPLYPVLAGLLAQATQLDAATAGLLLNLVLSVCLIRLCADDLRQQGRPVDPLFVGAFFALYPFNIWYFSQYSEAVFGVALVGAIVALRRGLVLPAAALCFLLGMARPTGFALSVCIAACECLTGAIGRNASATPWRRLPDAILLVAASGAGLSLFVVHLDHLMGDGFAFMHVQVAWHRRFRFFVLHIAHVLGHRHWVGQGVFAIAGFVLIGWLLWTRRVFAGLVVGVTALLACSTSAASIERFVFSNPLVIEIGAWLAWRLDRRRKVAVMAAMAALQLVAIELWFSGSDILT